MRQLKFLSGMVREPVAWMAAGVPGLSRTTPSGSRYRRHTWRTGLILTLPATLFVLVFMIYPVLSLVYLSLHEYSPLRSAEMRFVGMDNYRWLATSDQVLSSLRVTLIFTGASVTLEVAAGLIVAALLSKYLIESLSGAGRFIGKLLSSAFILPFAAPAVAAAVAWKMLLQPQFGPINALLGTDTAWFAQYPLLSVIVADAWKMTPLVMFLLLAAIMSIEPDQYEAAKLDGANFWQETWYLTIPAILPILAVTTAFRAVDAFTKIFDTVYVTTGGGPNRATEVFPLLIWNTAFSYLHFGQAGALAVVAVLISVTLGGVLLVRRPA